MLTGLDFPEELLYGENAVWVRDDGGGSVRLGLNFYALLAGGGAAPGDVIHVRLPRPGAEVRRGETVGHLDLERATFDLVTPVSGTVFVANPDLRDEPGLLARAPYGAGFLLDLENVPREEVEALMDRDQALIHYSRFEPDGAFRASMRIEPGRPWPTSVSARFGERFFVRGRLVPPAANEIFVPDWETGDCWTVETKVGALVRRFRYLVEGDGRTAGDEVTRVRVTEVGDGAAPERILHIRRDDFTLAAWDLVPKGAPGLAARTYNERGRESWLRCGHEDGFFLDHAKLPSGIDDEAREIPAGLDKGPLDAGVEDMYAGLLPPITSYVKFRAGLTRLEVELRADLPRLEGGTARLFSMQTWERGKPWWSEAYRTLEERELIRAKLLD
jgi:glycine cleavage system H protein